VITGLGNIISCRQIESKLINLSKSDMILCILLFISTGFTGCRIFVPKREEVPGERRKLHNEELRNVHLSPDIIRQIKSRRMRWAGHVAHMGEERKAYKVLVGKPEGKRPLGRLRRRWEDGIRMDFREIGWRGVDCVRLVQDRDRWRAVVNVMINLWVFAPRS
jgi:hypothetical protein